MKRYISLAFALVLLLGTVATTVVAASSNTATVSNQKVLYTSNGYCLADETGPYITISAVCEKVEKSFLFIPYQKYISSVRFEVFEDKAQTVRIAEYRTKDWETWRQKDAEAIINHDATLKRNNVYALACEVARLDNEIVYLAPAFAGDGDEKARDLALKGLLENQFALEIANSSQDVFCDAVNQVVDEFMNEVQGSVESALVDVAVGCANEWKGIQDNAYEDPYEKKWWQKIGEWIWSFLTGEKESAPDVKNKSIIARAYATSQTNILNGIGKVNYAGIDYLNYTFGYGGNFAIYKREYQKVFDKDMAALPSQHQQLCDIIIELDQ